MFYLFLERITKVEFFSGYLLLQKEHTSVISSIVLLHLLDKAWSTRFLPKSQNVCQFTTTTLPNSYIESEF